MRQVAISAALLVYLDELTYSEAAVAADPDAADLAPAFEAQIGDWDGMSAKERSVRRAVTRADAVIAVRNAELDWTTTQFGGAVLVEANQDRHSPAFKRFFKNVPSELIRTSLRKQCEYTRDVILTELAKVEAKNPLKPYSARFDKAVKSALSALDARAQAYGERATVGTEVLEYKEGVNRLRTTIHAELTKRAAEKGYGRAWVESFFRPASQAVGEDDPTTPAAIPSPAPTS